MGNGGVAVLSELVTDAATTVQVDDGGNWNGGSNSEYRGLFTGFPGSTVRVSGEYFTAPALDEAATNQVASFVVALSGLTATIDPLIQPATAVVRRGGETHVGGMLAVNVRNPNVLRIGDVFPIFEHGTTATGQFAALTTPVLGGGRALEMFQDGSPATTYVRVIAATPSCYTVDFDGDGDLGTDSDIQAFFECLSGTAARRARAPTSMAMGTLGQTWILRRFSGCSAAERATLHSPPTRRCRVRPVEMVMNFWRPYESCVRAWDGCGCVRVWSGSGGHAALDECGWREFCRCGELGPGAGADGE